MIAKMKGCGYNNIGFILEKAIDSEKDEDLRDALQELNDFLCGF